jgi:hypothetical protein
MNVDFVLVGLKELGELDGRRGRVRIGNIDNQPIRENPCGGGDCDRARRERFLVDSQVRKTLGLERKRLGLEPERVLQEAVLCLKMLRTQERTFHPDNRLQLLHGVSRQLAYLGTSSLNL